MITIEQIKAARALLGWNQQDLANASGTSKPAIANLERRLSKPRSETLLAIQSALEEAGIEFTEGPGVKLNSDTLKVEIFKGKDSIQRLWNDIYESLKPNEERLISGVSEEYFLSYTGDNFSKMMEKYKKKGITGRILSMEGDRNFQDFTSEYRWLPKEFFNNVPYYVYKNKYAILIWEPSPRVVMIENAAIANAYRKQFEYQWRLAMKPKALVSN